MNSIKHQLYQQCLSYVQTRMDAALQAIEAARQAQHDDTKSSAGDKYETGREMAQQETDRHMAQLTEANKLKIALNNLNPDTTYTKADSGAVVCTSKGNFYISISAGVLSIGGTQYVAISPASPIALKMRGLKSGEKFTLNGTEYTVNDVI